MAGGFVSALAIQFGAVAGDLPYALVVWAGAAAMMSGALARVLLGATGTALLMWLGWTTLRDGWRSSGMPAPAASMSRQSFWIGAAISAANPFGITFWLSISGMLIQHPHWNASLFFGALFSSILLAGLALAAAVGRMCQAITPRWLRRISCGCGVALIGSSLLLGYTLL